VASCSPCLRGLLSGPLGQIDLAARHDQPCLEQGSNILQQIASFDDLIPHPGIVTLSRGLPIADVLASRLQGRQVQTSAFFQVMRRELGFPDEMAHLPIPEDLVLRVV